MAERRLSPLGLRLAAAFVTVAVLAVGVYAVLTVASTREQLAELILRVHRQDAEAAAEAAAMLEQMHGVEIVDLPRGDPVIAPVVVDGEDVGSLVLRFPASHLPAPEQQVRSGLQRTALVGAAAAVLVAIGIALFVARRVSRPLVALTDAATEMASGRRGVRVGLGYQPGELGVLATAFDRMSESVEQQEDLRRQLVRDVAHEVRTPLTILRGTTEGLVDGVLEPDQETLASLHDEVLRLTSLVGGPEA